MHAALTIARWVLGSILIYAAIFLYEDQEGRIQNTLEEWWIKIEDNRSKAVSKSAIFFRAVARVTNGVFDYLFGQDLFSSESIGSSFCLSASSLFISFSLSDILDRGMPKTVKHPVLFGGFGIAFFLLSLVRHLFNEHTWERVRDFWLLAISTVVVGPLIIGKGYPLLGGLLISFA